MKHSRSAAWLVIAFLVLMAVPAVQAQIVCNPNPPTLNESTDSGDVVLNYAGGGSANVIDDDPGFGTADISADLAFFGQGASYAGSGELVRVAGPHQVVWDGRDDAGRSMATDNYFALIRAGEERKIRKMVLLK